MLTPDRNRLFNEDIRGLLDSLEGSDDLMEFARWRKTKNAGPEIHTSSWNKSETTFIILAPDFPPAHLPFSPSTDSMSIYVTGRSPFFNESHFFNRGIRSALETGSKWVVLMSDDLYEVTPIRKLMEALGKLDNEEFDTIWIDPWPDYYHSYEAYLAKRHPLENVLGRNHLKLAKLCKKFRVETVIGSKTPIHKPLHFYAFSRLFPRPYVGPSFKMTSDFAILSAEWCRKQGPEVLCETFVGWQDCDLSLRLRSAKSTTIDFRIGSQVGGTIHPGFPKALRELFNLAILNWNIRKGIYDIR